MTNNYLWTDSEWTFPLLEKAMNEIQIIGEEKFKLETYPNQIEIISSDQMLSAYSSNGIPVFYEHWSFGRNLVAHTEAYKSGQMGLAYEIVINQSPCISYLMEENTMTMQALVMAHAAMGHNSFFCNNYCFKEWTDASSSLDYFIFARNYIRKCEEKYGYNEVEEILDSCHALQYHGIDKYRKPRKLSIEKEINRQEERERYLQQQVNGLWDTLIPKSKKRKKKIDKFPKESTENILYFIEKNSPMLKPWQREIVRIVRKTATYFYPQMITKVMNEGWATFHHYEIFREMENRRMVTEGAMIEFLKSHSRVIQQPGFDSKCYNDINVYTLGYNMFRDIKRMCDNPTAEDKEYFPDIAGSNSVETMDFIMRNFRDESFIMQYLSPKVMRDLQLFLLDDKGKHSRFYDVSAIHNRYGYNHIKKELSKKYDPNYFLPNIVVDKVNIKTDRSMELIHHIIDEKCLDDSTENVLKHVRRLWGFSVSIKSVAKDGLVSNTIKVD